MKNKVTLIGAGLGGLTTACYLAKKGFEVNLIEKNNQVGGRASVWKSKGYTFDLGPSWYLMPEVFEDFFHDFGYQVRDFFHLKKLDPSYRVFFQDEGQFNISSDLNNNNLIFDQFESQGGKKFDQYLEKTQFLYQTAMSQFIYQSYDQWLNPSNLKLLRHPRTIFSLTKSFDQFVSTYFSSDKAKKIMEYTNVFLGGSPQNTPALYSILSYVDFKLGVWYPMGGISQLPIAMSQIAKKLGVNIILSQEVKKVQIKNRLITRVHTTKKAYDTDLVVANADYAYFETKILPTRYQTYSKSFWKSKVIAPSAYLIYLGIDKKLKNLNHHNLFLAKDWDVHFKEIFDQPSWPDNPSYYVCAPSKTDQSVAPDGKENLFILVPVASGLRDTTKIRESYFDKIISLLEKETGEVIRPYIKVKRIFAQKDFKEAYYSFQGTALGLAHTLSQTAMGRPNHHSKKVNNLFYCGQYTHPGVGMPTSVISGKIVSDLIIKKYG
jgi:phytoene desaturase